MAYRHFSDSERSEISILLRRGYSHRSIAEALGRSQASISREIKRNSAKEKYDSRSAKVKARNRRKCSKYQGMKVRERPLLEEYIIEGLEKKRTPEAISGRIKTIDTHIPYVSAKGIYKWLYSAFGQGYCPLLPKQRYTPKKRRAKKTKRVMIPNRVGIEKRHAGANNRSRFGHFETDTMVSGRKTRSTAALTVLHDRKARYTRLKKIPSMKSSVNAEAITKMGKGLHRISITHDNGIENRHHKAVAVSLNIKTFFCNPYSSWEKGSVENTIGRIRRFIPKGADLNDYSDKDIQRIEDWLNHTPRKCLGFKTPYEIMTENLLFVSPHPK